MFRILRSPLVAVCLIVVGAFLIYTGHKNSVKFAALRDHGRTAKAEVTKLEWKERKTTHTDSLYTAHIRFSTQEGSEIQAEIGIPQPLARLCATTLRKNRSLSAIFQSRPARLKTRTRRTPQTPSKALGDTRYLPGWHCSRWASFFPDRGRAEGCSLAQPVHP